MATFTKELCRTRLKTSSGRKSPDSFPCCRIVTRPRQASLRICSRPYALKFAMHSLQFRPLTRALRCHLISQLLATHQLRPPSPLSYAAVVARPPPHPVALSAPPPPASPPVYRPPPRFFRPSNEWRTRDNRPICFACGIAGHIARFCRRRPTPAHAYFGAPTYAPQQTTTKTLFVLACDVCYESLRPRDASGVRRGRSYTVVRSRAERALRRCGKSPGIITGRRGRTGAAPPFEPRDGGWARQRIRRRKREREKRRRALLPRTVPVSRAVNWPLSH
ncbi:hypothetical protein HPB51_011722 [Rhipicephalus microplus]|uniref:CCHC-type domain-containing protein n=1 Tax=Rhipicephalus microplus TaxID=6941 RepID=A0A9J6DMC2_RHIMP|nr:hypothetical protein HPB51_011722 [Rhipicephalus microplus]